MEILAVDSISDNILLESTIKDFQLAVQLKSFNRFKDAISFLHQDHYIPDVLLIGSGIIIHEGIDQLFQIKSDEKCRAIPIIVLTEFIGEEHLFEENFSNTYFITRPLDFNEMPDLITRIFKFCAGCKQTVSIERSNNDLLSENKRRTG